MEKKYLKPQDLDCYRIATELSQYVWSLVRKWDYFSQDTIGKQFVRAVDSISANIAEGFGRYHKKEKILFYKYSYGSASESLDWAEKAHLRSLLSSDAYQHINSELQRLPRLINQLVQFTDKKLRH